MVGGKFNIWWYVRLSRRNETDLDFVIVNFWGLSRNWELLEKYFFLFLNE